MSMSAKRNRIRGANGRLKNSSAKRITLEKRMRDYSLAAVGVGAVAFAPAARGAVIVANLNHLVPVNTTYAVTVGGHNVMNVSNSTSTTSEFAFISEASVANRFWGPASLGRGKLPPVNPGALIPGVFPSHTEGPLVFSTEESNFTGFLGNGKFMGFSVGTGPNIHYGWVEFNISQPGGAHQPYSVTVVAAAYETVAGQALAAGATTDGPAPPTTPAPNSLWLLALGAAGIGGLELMRRRRGTA
jgi:hypothetical protein